MEEFIETRIGTPGEDKAHFAAPTRKPKIKTGLKEDKKNAQNS